MTSRAPLAAGGKSSISAFVGGMHAIVLWAVGLQGLWLPFGVLTFFLNFIPNVGGMGAVLLPLPIVALDPKFSSVQSTIAFAVPFCVNIFAKVSAPSERPTECP